MEQMEIYFEEFSADDVTELPEKYRDMLMAVAAQNDPPHIQSAQTYFLFKIEDGTIVKAWTDPNPAQVLLTFVQSVDWTYAIIPHSFSATGAVSSYSVISKAQEEPCKQNWLQRLGTRVRYF